MADSSPIKTNKGVKTIWHTRRIINTRRKQKTRRDIPAPQEEPIVLQGGADIPNAAFYAGVGYGKALNGQELLGFNSDDDRKSFERGALRHENYFKPYGEEEKPKGFFARLIYLFKE